MATTRPTVKLYCLRALWRSEDPALEVVEAEETAKLYRIRNGNGRYASYTQIEKAYAGAKGYHLTPEACLEAAQKHATQQAEVAEIRLRDAQEWQQMLAAFIASDWRSTLTPAD